MMRRLEERVGPVLGVADPIVVQARDLRAQVLPDLPVPAAVLVDVVAEVDDQVELVPGHVLVGGEQALLVVLARCEGEPERVGP